MTLTDGHKDALYSDFRYNQYLNQLRAYLPVVDNH